MRDTKVKVAICAASLCISSALIVSAVLAQIAAAFPEVGEARVQLIMSVSGIASFLFTLITGGMSGKFQQKHILAAGLVCSSLGVLPLIFGGSIVSYYLVGFFTGVGQGILIVATASSISIFFEGETRSKMFGYNVALSDGGLTILLAIAGWLSINNWKHAFYAYLLLIPVLVLVIFCMPENVPGAVTEEDKQEKQDRKKASVSRTTVIIALFSFVYQLSYYTWVMNTSIYVADKGIGSASQAAFALSLSMAAGMGSGMIFHYVYRIFKFNIISAGCILTGAGFILMILIPNYTMLLFAGVLAGAGWNWVAAGGNNLIAELEPMSQVSSAQGIKGAAISIACAVSAPIINFISGLLSKGNSAVPFLVSIVLLTLCMIVALIWAGYMKKAGKTTN